MTKIVLSPHELLYIAVCLGATEVFGVEDAYYGMNETEIKTTIINLQTALEEREYATANFNGSFEIADNVRTTVEIVAKCERLIVVNDTDTFYSKGEKIISLQKSGKACVLSDVPDLANDILSNWDGESDLCVQVTKFDAEYSTTQCAVFEFNNGLSRVDSEKGVTPEFEYIEREKREPIDFEQAKNIVREVLA